MTEYFALLWSLLQGGLIALTVLTAIDLIFGVLVALFIKKDFKWVYLNHFVTSDVLPSLVWVAVVIITTIPAIPKEIFPIVSGTIFVFVAGGIVASILESFSAIGILTNTLGKIGVGDKSEPK